jgi:RimJ/RimL family protein N-acetyltransferase
MIHELKVQDFKRARQVYEGLSYNLVIQSVIEHNTTGKIYVDDTANPRGALLWNNQDALLLEGTPCFGEFNQSLAKIISKQIIPNAFSRGIPVLSLHYFPDAWEKAIQNTLLKYMQVEKAYRNLYWFKAMKMDWRKNIPSGLSMCRIDAELLEQSHLKNIQELYGWISSFWRTSGDFLSKGIGYCLLDGDTITSWCLSVYAGGQNYELGLATIPPYRNQGHASLTSAACVAYCVEHQIVPHWHCYNTNASSIAVAEKVGFEKVMEYPVFRFQTHLSVD